MKRNGLKGVALVVLAVLCPWSAMAEDIVPVGLFATNTGESFDEQWEKVNAIAPISQEAFANVRDDHRNMLSNMADQIARIEAAGKTPAVPSTCFTPDTPEETIYIFGAFFSALHDTGAKFQPGPRWSITATDGAGLLEGDATTLTISFPSDGISVLSGIDPGSYAPGESDTPNNLNASFDAEFGSTATWKALFEDVFDDWSERAGLSYVFDVSDDDAAFPLTGGALGSRGDVRIAGHTIDGSSGILAYNYFPNTGDMVMDTADSGLFGNTSNSFRFLRNTVSHEHGHGLGFFHVCPINGTKLMEPFINTSFDHSTEDDIRHANRKYGDHNEKSGGNDIVLNATALGSLPDGTTNVDDNVSIDGATDIDYYAFSVAANATVSFTLAPVGTSYSEGAQNAPSGSDPDGCGTSSLSTTDAAAVMNLDLEVLDFTGTLSLGDAAVAAAGANETITDLELGAGDYVLRVDTSDLEDLSDTQVQMYSLAIDVAAVLGVTGVSVSASEGFVQEGDDITLTANTTGATPDTYQWIKDDVDISGQTAATLALTSLTLADSGEYKVRVTDSSKATLTSAPYILNVLAAGALPVGGGVGIALLAGACALAGIAAARRRK